MIYKPFNSVFIRVPRLSLNQLRELLYEEESLFLERIKRYPMLKQAIERASKTLYKDFINNKNDISTLTSCYNYLSRISTKAVPYDLFSGLGYGELDNYTSEVFNLESSIDVNLNLDVLYYLCEDFIIDNISVSKLKYYPNETIYRFQNEIRYFKSFYHSESLKIGTKLSSVELTPLLKELLRKGRIGLKYDEMLKIIKSKGYSEPDSEIYLVKIIKSKLFTSELFPKIERGSFIEQVCDTLSKRGYKKTIFHFISTRISKLESNPNSSKIEKEIIDKVACSSLTRNIITKNILFKNTFTIDKSLSKDIIKALKILNFYSESRNRELFKDFKEEFKFRYGEKKVPLLIALDPELGINNEIKEASKNELLSDIYFQMKNMTSSKGDLFKTLYQELISSNYDVNDIKLNSEIYNKAKKLDLRLSKTFSAVIEVGKNEHGNTIIYLKEVGNISASILTSKYTTISKGAYKFNQEVLRKEESNSKNTIIAEVCYLPRDEAANIVARNAERKYVLRFCSSYADSSENNEIELSDLYLSVENNNLQLTSKKLGCSILPFSSNPYNYSIDRLPLSRFLSNYYKYKCSYIDLLFEVNQLVSSFQYVPRISFENIILVPRTWNISTSDLNFIMKNTGQVALVRNWASKINLDKEFYLVEERGDLYFNLNSDESITIFIRSIKGKSFFQLKEFFYNKNQSIIIDDNKHEYAHELIASFYAEE